MTAQKFMESDFERRLVNVYLVKDVHISNPNHLFHALDNGTQKEDFVAFSGYLMVVMGEEVYPEVQFFGQFPNHPIGKGGNKYSEKLLLLKTHGITQQSDN